jgi:hypothetical protein
MKYFLSMLLICSLFVSCKKEISSSSNNEQALAENDNSSAGVYKGVIVGSSGTVKILLLNGNATVKAFITFNGIKDTLTATTTVTAGQTISNLTFIGKKMSFAFSTSASGGNPTIANIIYSGYSTPIKSVIAKELSTQLVNCYEGTYNGSNSIGGTDIGTFNCIIFGDKIVGLARSTTFSTFDQISGTVSASGAINASGNITSGATFRGSFIGNTCNGTWTNTSAGYSGTWSGTKTL